MPDGTIVRFSVVLTGEGGGILQQVESPTAQGIARASFGLDKPGLLEIRAASDPATLSEVLQLDVSSGSGAAVTVIVPYVVTQTPEPTATSVTPIPEDKFVTDQGYPRFNAWFIDILFIFASTWLTYWALSRIKNVRDGVRWALCVLLGGTVAYMYLIFGLPGSQSLGSEQGMFGIMSFTFAGELAGLLGAWFWMRRSSAAKSPTG